MGVSGPIPKRAEERRRRNKADSSGNPNEPEKLVVDPADMDDVSQVAAPDPDPEWHLLAMFTYEQVKRSAVREIYEPSDWAVLFIALDQLSRNLKPQPVVVQSGPMAGQVVMVDVPMNGSQLSAIMGTFSKLMLTEGDRRRLRLEVERVSGSGAAGNQAQPTGDNVIDIRRERFGS